MYTIIAAIFISIIRRNDSMSERQKCAENPHIGSLSVASISGTLKINHLYISNFKDWHLQAFQLIKKLKMCLFIRGIRTSQETLKSQLKEQRIGSHEHRVDCGWIKY